MGPHVNAAEAELREQLQLELVAREQPHHLVELHAVQLAVAQLLDGVGAGVGVEGALGKLLQKAAELVLGEQPAGQGLALLPDLRALRLRDLDLVRLASVGNVLLGLGLVVLLRVGSSTVSVAAAVLAEGRSLLLLLILLLLRRLLLILLLLRCLSVGGRFTNLKIGVQELLVMLVQLLLLLGVGALVSNIEVRIKQLLMVLVQLLLRLLILALVFDVEV